MVSLLAAFVKAAAQPGTPGGRADTFVYIVLSVMPWAGRDLSERDDANFDTLMSDIGTYLRNRSEVHVPLVNIISDGRGKPKPLDVLQVLWKQVVELRKRDSWKEVMIHRPYIDFIDELEKTSVCHDLPEINIAAHKDGIAYQIQHVPFRLFDSADTIDDNTLPPSHAVERFIGELIVGEMLQVYGGNLQACVRRLMLFSSDNRQFAIIYMIVEIIVGELLRLPTPPKNKVFYYTLLAELVSEHRTYTAVIGLAMDIIFQRIHLFERESVTRCVEWMAHFHNFYDFSFRWSAWKSVEAEDSKSDSPQQLFVRAVLARCLRLSYHTRIARAVPLEFAAVAPPDPATARGFGRLPEQTRAAFQYDALMKYVQKKEPDVAALQPILDSISAPAKLEAEDGEHIEVDDINIDADSPENFVRLTQTKCFTSCVLEAGGSTFTLLLALVERHLDGFKLVNKDAAARLLIVRTVHTFWCSRPQMIVMILEGLLRYNVVDAVALVEHIFSEEAAPLLVNDYVWECFFNALDYTASQIDALRVKIAAGGPDADDSGGGSGAASAGKHESLVSELKGAENTMELTFTLVFDKFAACLKADGEHPCPRGLAIARFRQTARTYCVQLTQTGLWDTLETIGRTAEEDADVNVIIRQARGLADLSRVS